MEIIPRFELEFRHPTNDKEAMEELFNIALSHPRLPKGFFFNGASTEDFRKEAGFFITRIHFGYGDVFETKITLPKPPKSPLIK